MCDKKQNVDKCLHSLVMEVLFLLLLCTSDIDTKKYRDMKGKIFSKPDKDRGGGIVIVSFFSIFISILQLKDK